MLWIHGSVRSTRVSKFIFTSFFASLFGSSTCNVLNLDLQLHYMYDSVMQEPKQNSCHQRGLSEL